MFSFKLSQIANFIFIIFILLVPINNSFEVIAMMKGVLPYGGWSSQLTPLFVKLYKDLFLLLFVFYIGYKCLKNTEVRFILSNHVFFPIHGFLICVVLSFFISLFKGDMFISLIGLRSYLAIIYVYLGVIMFKTMNIKMLSKVMLIVLIFQMILQITQFWMGSGVGVFAELRSPGFFIVPATAGLFSVLLLNFFLVYKNKKCVVMSLISSLLATSTAGYAAVAFSFLYCLSNSFSKKNLLAKRIIFFFVSFFSAIFFVMNAAILSGRGNAIYESFNERIRIIERFFLDADLSTFLWGGHFGRVTSQGVLLNVDGNFISDNTFLSVYASMGVIPLFFLIFFLWSIYVVDRFKLIFFAFSLYSLTANIFELNPVSPLLMFFIGIGFSCYIYEKKYGISNGNHFSVSSRPLLR